MGEPAINLRPTRSASGEAPVSPVLLSPTAAAIPAHGVPWVSSAVVGDGSLGSPSFQL